MIQLGMKQTAWSVFLGGDEIDVVFFDSRCDHDYVKSSLINHDGLDSGISVVKQ